jgi:putative ABC transport system substrate-binding protein
MISRRRVLMLACGVPLTGLAQSTMARIGFLSPLSEAETAARLAAFRTGLRELGYVEGRNITIEFRGADDRYERLPALAAELVKLRVDVLVTFGTPGTRAAKQATATIPIVMAGSGDAVASGLVASLARPSGNVTGSTFFVSEINVKRLQLLREAMPEVRRVAILLNPKNSSSESTFHEMEAAARPISMRTRPTGCRALSRQ